MRRFLAGLLAALFLAVVAVESAHHHGASAPQASCALCAATTQARHAPSARPAPARARAIASVLSEKIVVLPTGAAVAAGARDPPVVA